MIDKNACKARLEKLRKGLADRDLDGVVIVPGPNMQYFTGIESLLLERPFILLVPYSGAPQLVAPALESGPYRNSPMPLSIHPWTDSEGYTGALAKAVKSTKGVKTLGVEGKVPFLFLHRLMQHSQYRFEDAEPILQTQREIKDQAEVDLLKRSAEILSKSFRGFPDILRTGATESELAKAATEMIYSNGATKVDAMLVQSGWRAADPHGLPTSKKVGRGESIIFDVGSTFEGYYADMTRTFCIGKSEDVEEVYRKVLEAEEKGIATAASGVEVGKVDGASRNVLKKAGLGDYFIHRTGHGLGLEVHEAPYIVEGGREKLAPGMCFTVEPGVYKTGKLGVRMEDNVLIEGRRGLEITNTPKEFGWWS